MTRGRRAAAGLVLGLCAATGLVAAPTPEPAAAALAAPAAAAPADPVVDRRIRDPRVLEASGLAPSLRHPGVLWTHNDSGNAPRLFALGRDGAVAATLRVSGTANEDWEALATLRDRDGRPVLAVGDVGDNASARTSVEIAVVREPRTLADAVVRPVRRLSLRYPDGAQDAEALLADPRTGRLYVVTKGLISSGVYAVPRAVWPGRAGRPADRGTLEPVATYTLTLATDGVVSADGHVLMRTYGRLSLFPPLPRDPGGGAQDPPRVAATASTGLPREPQGEGLTLTPDGRSVLLVSEGERQPVYRVPLPRDLLAAMAAQPSSGPSPGPSTGPSPAPQDRPSAGPNGRSPDAGTAPGTAAAPAAAPSGRPLGNALPFVAGGGVVLLVLLLTRARRR